METKELSVQHTEFGLSETEATQIASGISTIVKEREILESQYIDLVMEEITPELSEQARELRLRIRDNRTKGLMKWHKANKQYFLKGGQFVDAIKNVHIVKNEQMESKLHDIENYEANLEKERKQKLADERLKEIGVYATEEDLSGMDLGDLSESAYKSFLSASKANYEQAKREQEEAEKKAKEEAERLAKIEEENRKLREEIKAREAKEEAERIKKQDEAIAAKRRREKIAKAPVREKLLEWLDRFSEPGDEFFHDLQKEIIEDFNQFTINAENKINNL